MVVSPSAANSGVTAFPACQYVYNDFSTCSAYAAVSSAYQYYNCYCQQKFFEALFDCDSEEHLYLGSGTEPDPHFSQKVSIWHSECDPKTNYTPTTPIVSSITASYNVNHCLTAEQDCESLTQQRAICTQNYDHVPAASLTSCLCQPPLLTLAYESSNLGNVSCIQFPAALSNMAEYGHCSNLNAVLTLPPSVTASLGTGTTVRFTDFTPSSTRPASTPILTTAPPAPASSITTPGSASMAAPSQGEGYRYTEKSSSPWMLGLWSASLFIVALLNIVVKANQYPTVAVEATPPGESPPATWFRWHWLNSSDSRSSIGSTEALISLT